LASNKQSTQLNVKKYYEFIFKGEKYMLEEGEAREIKRLFADMLPDKDDTVKSSSPAFKGMMDNVVIYRRRIVPEGFVKIGSSETEPKMGNKPTIFEYYRHEDEGVYAFRVPTQERLAFCRLGKLSDPNSIIGRTVRNVPEHDIFNREIIKKLGIVKSSEYRKALCEILEIEGYFKKATSIFNRNQHARHIYKRTNKIDGLGVDNNHGLLERRTVIP
jgi:hypothetical protein